MIRQATAESRTGITLTEQVVDARRVGDHTKMLTPPAGGTGLPLHAASLDAVKRSQFQLWLAGADARNSMVGRFAHLLPVEDQQRLAATYTPQTIAAQLSFRPVASTTRTSPAHLDCCHT